MAKKVKQEEKPMGWKDVLPVIGVGLALILISVIGIRTHNSLWNEYNHSTDVRIVEAEVTYVSYHTVKEDKLGDPNYKRPEWRAKFQYTIDGKTFTGKETYHSKVQPGDKVKVKVYRNKKGDYRPRPNIFSQTQVTIMNVVCYGILVVGGLLVVAAFGTLLSGKAKEKRKKQ